MYISLRFYCSVKELAEGLNATIMDWKDEFDDNYPCRWLNLHSR